MHHQFLAIFYSKMTLDYVKLCHIHIPVIFTTFRSTVRMSNTPLLEKLRDMTLEILKVYILLILFFIKWYKKILRY